MKRNDRMVIKYEWLDMMKTLNDVSFRGVLMAIVGYAQGQGDISSVPREAEVIFGVIAKDMDKAKRKAQCGALGGNPRLKRVKAFKERGGRCDPSLFDEFWEAYPKKVGKKYAKECFERIKPTRELLEKMKIAIAEQKKSEQWRDKHGKFIPNPSTWLNQGRWMDEGIAPNGQSFEKFNIGVRI